MAQPNMVREPSMDEILASIRRIIESNEPVTQASVAATLADAEGFSVHPANDDSEAVMLTVDDEFADTDDTYDDVEATLPVLRAIAETRTESAVVRDISQADFQQVRASEPPKALSLADVAARVRAASERRPIGRDGGYAQPAAESPAVEAPTIAAEPVEAEHASSSKPAHAGPADDDAREAQAQAGPVAAASMPEEPQAAEPEAVEPEAAPVSLLSSSAGEQVARSFQELAFAVDSAERRSFDEIAEEMLRPMLQEWLDDNLPTLVERLVREEIERVARGPRR